MMKKQNSVDILVESLASEFSKIKNFDLMQDEPMGKLSFSFVVKNVFELNSFKNLFIHFFLPATLKSTEDYLKELKFSKYKNLIEINHSELKENYFETVRLGYVGAYHKYESYIKRLPHFMDEFFEPLFVNGEYKKIEDYLKESFDVELKKTINVFYASEKINWISNCVKHYDSYPIKEPILYWFRNADKSKKIELDGKEFKEDLENLAKQNQLILTTLFLVGFHQFMSQDFEKIKNELSENKTEIDLELTKEQIGSAIKLTFEKNFA